MRTLYILRHGEAAAAQGGKDRDRALTPDGMAAMEALAPMLAAMPAPPTTVLCSPARRTRETQRAAAPSLPVQIIEGLYEAEPRRILDFIRDTDINHRAALVVGHNPGLQELVMALARNGDEEYRARAAQGFPPGALAVIETHLPRWDGMAPDNTKLVNLLLPPFAAISAA